MSSITFTNVVAPKPLVGSINPKDILFGMPMPKIDRLRVMSPDNFEDMVAEWAHGYLKKDKYPKGVQRFGGAGDKGRDVVGYYDNGKIDIYQCKHYDRALSPSQYWIEFGKLCYYTFSEDYPVPECYYIVCPNGVGPMLQHFIDNPESLRDELIKQWPDKCESKITKSTSILLKGDFLAHLTNFDFSIVEVLDQYDLIEQHSKTVHHSARFGGGLLRSRKKIPKADQTIQAKELIYVNPLYEVYSEILGKSVSNQTELKTYDSGLHEHFSLQRDGFYSAESLQRFSRDSFPESSPKPFDELKDEARSITSNTLAMTRGESGMKRLGQCIENLQNQQFRSNVLSDEMKAGDKSGLCHHLVVDGVILSWIKK